MTLILPLQHGTPNIVLRDLVLHAIPIGDSRAGWFSLSIKWKVLLNSREGLFGDWD